MNFHEASEVTINSEAAEFALFEDYYRLRGAIEEGTYTPSYSAAYLLRMGVISLAKGMASKSDEMMARGQRYYHLGLAGTKAVNEIISRPDLTVLTNDAYLTLVGHNLKADIQKVKQWCHLHTFIEFHRTTGTALGHEIESALLVEAFNADMESYNTHFSQCNEAAVLLLDALMGYRTMRDKPHTARAYVRYAIKLIRKRLADVPPVIKQGLIGRVISDFLATNTQSLTIAAWKAANEQQHARHQYKVASWLKSYAEKIKPRESQLSIQF